MRTVVFDLDGTLADTSQDLIAAANACFAAQGQGEPLNPVADALTAFGGGRAMLRLGMERLGHGSEDDIDAQYPVLLEHYDANIDRHTALYPGVVEALDLLMAQGWVLAVCTNKPAALADKLLKKLGVMNYFGAMLGADSLPIRKPDPEHYFETVRRAGGAIERSVLIGDTRTDRDTARNAKVPIILVGFGPEGQGIERLEPDAILPHYQHLPDILEALVPR